MMYIDGHGACRDIRFVDPNKPLLYYCVPFVNSIARHTHLKAKRVGVQCGVAIGAFAD